MTLTTPATSKADLTTAAAPFLAWLQDWMGSLQPLDLQNFLRNNAISPDRVAVVSADLVEGFCYHGPLASPRIAGVVEPSADLFRRAYELGVRNFVLVQEYHTHDAPEFDQFGPHCIRGTDEAKTVDALASLPFADLSKVVLKNSLHPALHTDLNAWMQERPNVNTFIVVGDCTDLCVYQGAMHFKLATNAANRRANVIVPDGDFLHALFLYHMALNGIQVVSNVT
jgi:nicotinamidase-related amidase